MDKIKDREPTCNFHLFLISLDRFHCSFLYLNRLRSTCTTYRNKNLSKHNDLLFINSIELKV